MTDAGGGGQTPEASLAAPLAAPEASLAAAVAELRQQGLRTASWVRGLPAGRFTAAEGAIPARVRALIAEADSIARAAVDAAPPGAIPATEVPPGDARPPELAAHALGDQLTVMVEQAARVIGYLPESSENPPQSAAGGSPEATREAGIAARVSDLAAACLDLRIDPPGARAGFH